MKEIDGQSPAYGARYIKVKPELKSDLMIKHVDWCHTS